jgi:uncharacterized membrane-anchored protein
MANVTMGLLLGDISGDGVVDSTDTHRTKVDRGQHTNSTNFREDIDTNGRIDTIDFSLIKSQVGTMLPP